MKTCFVRGPISSNCHYPQIAFFSKFFCAIENLSPSTASTPPLSHSDVKVVALIFPLSIIFFYFSEDCIPKVIRSLNFRIAISFFLLVLSFDSSCQDLAICTFEKLSQKFKIQKIRKKILVSLKSYQTKNWVKDEKTRFFYQDIAWKFLKSKTKYPRFPRLWSPTESWRQFRPAKSIPNP